VDTVKALLCCVVNVVGGSEDNTSQKLRRCFWCKREKRTAANKRGMGEEGMEVKAGDVSNIETEIRNDRNPLCFVVTVTCRSTVVP
jgi:hypothetical protein